LSEVKLLTTFLLFTFEILYCYSIAAAAPFGVLLLAWNPAVEEGTLFAYTSLLTVLDIADIRLLLVGSSLILGCSELL